MQDRLSSGSILLSKLLLLATIALPFAIVAHEPFISDSQVAGVSAATPPTKEDPVQKECETLISKSVERGQPINTANESYLPSIGSYQEPSKCVGVLFVKTTECEKVPQKNPACYQCTGKSAQINQTFAAGGSPKVSSIPDRSVPKGTCQIRICKADANNKIQCSAPVARSFADDLASLWNNPASVAGQGFPTTGTNTSSASKGVSELAEYIQKKYDAQCAGRPETPCYVSVPQEELQKAGFTCNRESWFSSDCMVETGAAKQKLQGLLAGGDGVEMDKTFAPTSGITADPKLLNALKSNAAYLNDSSPGSGYKVVGYTNEGNPILRNESTGKTEQGIQPADAFKWLGEVPKPGGSTSNVGEFTGTGGTAQPTPEMQAHLLSMLKDYCASHPGVLVANNTRCPTQSDSTIGNIGNAFGKAFGGLGQVFSGIGSFLGCIISLGFYCKAS